MHENGCYPGNVTRLAIHPGLRRRTCLASHHCPAPCGADPDAGPHRYVGPCSDICPIPCPGVHPNAWTAAGRGCDSGFDSGPVTSGSSDSRAGFDPPARRHADHGPFAGRHAEANSGGNGTTTTSSQPHSHRPANPNLAAHPDAGADRNTGACSDPGRAAHGRAGYAQCPAGKRVGALPLALGSNGAAQVHAETAKDGCFTGHWGLNGTTSGMRYALAGGYQINAESMTGLNYCIQPHENFRRITGLKTAVQDAAGNLNSSPDHYGTAISDLFHKVNLGIAWDAHIVWIVHSSRATTSVSGSCRISVGRTWPGWPDHQWSPGGCGPERS